MDYSNQNDFSDAKRREQARTPTPPPPPPPFPGIPRPGSGTGPGPGFGPGPGPGFGPRPGPGFGPGPGPEGPRSGAPTSAPPNYTPSRQITTFRVDPSSIRNCLGRFTYVWMSNGDEFWMFPIQVSRNTVTGFRWNRFFRWSFFGVSLNRIDAFTCV